MTGLAVVGIVGGAGLLAWLLASRPAAAAPGPRRPEGREPGTEPADPPPIEVGFRPIPDPPAASIPPPGGDPDDPSLTPRPGTWYRVQRGNRGVGIARRAYGLPRNQSGAAYRAWLSIRAHERNRVLSPTGISVWDGRLVSRHDGYAPRGTGYQFPTIWIPEAP